MCIHHDIVSYTIQSAENEMPFLCSIDANKFTVAAFYNFDHNKDTLCGIGLSHDTVAVMLQRKTGSQQGKPSVSQTNVAHGSNAFYAELNCQSLQNFIKPTIKPKLSDYFNLMSVTLNRRLL